MKEKEKSQGTTGQEIKKPDNGTTPMIKAETPVTGTDATVEKPRGGTTQIKKGPSV